MKIRICTDWKDFAVRNIELPTQKLKIMPRLSTFFAQLGSASINVHSHSSLNTKLVLVFLQQFPNGIFNSGSLCSTAHSSSPCGRQAKTEFSQDPSHASFITFLFVNLPENILLHIFPRLIIYEN